MDLRHGLVVHDVVDLAGAAAFEGGDNGGHHVVAVDHVEEPFAFGCDARLVAEILLEQMPALRAVDAGHPQNDGGKIPLAGGLEQQGLGFDKQPAGGALRRGWRVFLHQRAVGLRVNTGAAGVNEFLRRRRREPLDEIAGAFQVNGAVFVGAAFAGGNGVDDPFERRGQFCEVAWTRNVGGERMNSGGGEFGVGGAAATEAEDLVALLHKFGAEREPDVAAAYNQYAHGGS